MARNIAIPKPPRTELYELYVTRKMTYQELSVIYKISPATLSKWMKEYKIKTRGAADTTVIGKVLHKRCFGPSHPAGGAYVPITKFNKNKGKALGVYPRCHECLGNARVNFNNSYKAWVVSIVRRLGVMETCRRLEIHDKTLRQWLGKVSPTPKTIRREKAKLIVKVMAEIKANDEVRHRDSIRRGATLRGEAERTVKSRKDLYHRAIGQADTDYKRRKRATDPEFQERERERDRQRRRNKSLTTRDAA